MTLEKQSMLGLMVEPVWEGYDPIARQRQLQEVIYRHRPDAMAQHQAAPTLYGLMQRTRFNMEAIIVELVELLDHLPWKAWKTYDVSLDGILDDHTELVTEMKFEVVDIAHFLYNIAIALGMDYQEFLAIFEAKQRENRRRQEEGY